MKARACWPVLEKKARELVDQRMAEAAEIRKKVTHLQASHARMQALLADYKRRATETQQRLHTMAESLNYRNFVQQLQALLSRIEQDLSAAQTQLQAAQKLVLQAEHQRIKMASLAEQDAKAVAHWERRQEQKTMDALGVTLHNLKA